MAAATLVCPVCGEPVAVRVLTENLGMYVCPNAHHGAHQPVPYDAWLAMVNPTPTPREVAGKIVEDWIAARRMMDAPSHVRTSMQKNDITGIPDLIDRIAAALTAERQKGEGTDE